MDDPASIRDRIAGLVRARLAAPLSDEALRSANFADLGFDSEMLVVMSGELSDIFEIDIDPVDAFEFSTIDLLAAHVADRRRGAEPGCDGR